MTMGIVPMPNWIVARSSTSAATLAAIWRSTRVGSGVVKSGRGVSSSTIRLTSARETSLFPSAGRPQTRGIRGLTSTTICVDGAWSRYQRMASFSQLQASDRLKHPRSSIGAVRTIR